MPNTSTTEFKPAIGRVLVQPINEDGEKVLDSGIIIPQTSASKTSTMGRVIATGKGSSFTKGQRVVFTQYAGFTLPFGGEDFLLIDEHEVLGWFDEE